MIATMASLHMLACVHELREPSCQSTAVWKVERQDREEKRLCDAWALGSNPPGPQAATPDAAAALRRLLVCLISPAAHYTTGANNKIIIVCTHTRLSAFCNIRTVCPGGCTVRAQLRQQRQPPRTGFRRAITFSSAIRQPSCRCPPRWCPCWWMTKAEEVMMGRQRASSAQYTRHWRGKKAAPLERWVMTYPGCLAAGRRG